MQWTGEMHVPSCARYILYDSIYHRQDTTRERVWFNAESSRYHMKGPVSGSNATALLRSCGMYESTWWYCLKHGTFVPLSVPSSRKVPVFGRLLCFTTLLINRSTVTSGSSVATLVVLMKSPGLLQPGHPSPKIAICFSRATVCRVHPTNGPAQ